MGKIKVLPIILINKIAAGEVIERPASAVKELMENSIDSGAKAIEVFLESGGKRSIRVTDDGRGIDKEDLPLAFASHATSKLETVEDLFKIRTLGFRGEALASIGSVSRCSIVSRPHGSQSGCRMDADGGQLRGPVPEGCPEGTTIEISNLFFNTPARRKFMRGDDIEFSHCADAFARFGAACPELRLELHHNGASILRLPANSTRMERIANLFGNEIAEGMTEIKESYQGLTLEAYAGKPSLIGTSSKRLFFYVNGRFIRDRILSKAVMDAYQDLLPARKYPYAFVFLSLQPEELDVNVHPAKTEVRFRKPNLIFDFMFAAFRKALMGSDLSANLPTGADPERPPMDHRTGAERAIADFFLSRPSQQEANSFANRQGQPPAQTQTYQSSAPEPAKLFSAPSGRFVQMHGSFIVEESPDGISIIDQHALHESLLYAELKRSAEEKKTISQKLLIPAVVELTTAEMPLFEKVKPFLEKFGFETADFGGGTIAVHAVPESLKSGDVAEMVRDVVISAAEWFPKGAQPSQLEEITDRTAKRLACRGAVKAGGRMNEKDIASLLARREDAEHSAACAHGRPTTLKITLEKLDKYFQR